MNSEQKQSLLKIPQNLVSVEDKNIQFSNLVLRINHVTVLFVEKCKDRLAAKTCQDYKPLCPFYKIIREMCAKSCGICERKYCARVIYEWSSEVLVKSICNYL